MCKHRTVSLDVMTKNHSRARFWNLELTEIISVLDQRLRYTFRDPIAKLCRISIRIKSISRRFSPMIAGDDHQRASASLGIRVVQLSSREYRFACARIIYVKPVHKPNAKNGTIINSLRNNTEIAVRIVCGRLYAI